MAQEKDTAGTYETAKRYIIKILAKEYHMGPLVAERAIRYSSLETLFSEYEEMAAHTSNEAWAKQVYEHWTERHRQHRQSVANRDKKH